MKGQALRCTFYNPNPPEAAADALLRVLVEANRGKAARALQAAARDGPAGKPAGEYSREEEELEHCRLLPGVHGKGGPAEQPGGPKAIF